MTRLAIIADDLTGALDSAVLFVGPGRRVVAATAPEAVPELLTAGAQVIAISTRSREMASEQAADRVRRVLSALPPGVACFKKIDSRMKGNIAAELAAFAAPSMLVCPAVPDLGRLVCNGAVTGAGVDAPIGVAARLGPLAERARIPDAATADDLAAVLDEAPPDALFVGARGLATALARRMYGPQGAAAPVVLSDPAVLVVGSTDPVTLAQLADLRAARPDAAMIAAPGGRVPPVTRRATLTVLEATESGAARAPGEVAAALAEGALPWLTEARTILATGGATAEALFDTLGATLLTLRGEAAPGMPACGFGDRILVTKSGGFGSARSLAALFPAGAEV